MNIKDSNLQFSRNFNVENLHISLRKNLTYILMENNNSLNEVRTRFSLTDEEFVIVGLCAMIENGCDFTSVFAFQNRTYASSLPSLDYLNRLIKVMFGTDKWLITESSVIWKLNLIDVLEPGVAIKNTERVIRLNSRVLRFLAGENESLASDLYQVVPTENKVILNNQSDSSAKKIALADLGIKVINISGSDFDHRVTFAKELCNIAGLSQILQINHIDTSDYNLHAIVIEVIKEAVLTNSLILINHDSNSLSRSEKIIEELSKLSWPVVFSSNFSNQLQNEKICDIRLTQHNTSEQFVCWKQNLPDESDLMLKNIIESYSLSVPAILKTISKIGYSNGVKNTIYNYLNEQDSSSSSLGAQKVKIASDVPALIFSAEKQLEFDNMLSDIQQRQSVLKDWGFEFYFKNRMGVNILFYGPSGTGKTHAASQIAASLNKTMYKVDLSMLVSKYVGETEKNIERIFNDLIKPSNLVFFDEADSLFAQRSEQKTSNDRFSNMEINYLLQRIEDHNGYVVLASNLERNMDSAFCRRFDYWIQFEMPGSTERLRLWQSAFPAQTPLGKIDFELLASKMEIAGANIRKIAFNAALSAKSLNSPIEMSHIVKAAEAEHRKTGQFFNNPLEESTL